MSKDAKTCAKIKLVESCVAAFGMHLPTDSPTVVLNGILPRDSHDATPSLFFLSFFLSFFLNTDH